MSAEPLKHIYRPNVPWRSDDRMTECGRDGAEFAAVISGDEAVDLVKELGKQRAAFVLCMTCMSTASRHGYGRRAQSVPQDWRLDPVEVLDRYLGSVRGARWGRTTSDSERIKAELHAIGALIEAHRDEFDEYVTGAADAPSLAEARDKKQARLQNQHRGRRL